jgi:hypothetical protein
MVLNHIPPTMPSSFSPPINDMRLHAHAAGGCFDQLLWVPKAIGEFVVHCYADLRMFIRSCCSMSGLTSEECTERVRQIIRLKEAVGSSGYAKTAVRAVFNRTDPVVRNLFFYADGNYLREFIQETDIEKEGSIRQEIFRECDRVICFQNTLCRITTFFKAWCGWIFGCSRNQERRSVHSESPPREREPAPAPRASYGVPVRAPSGRTVVSTTPAAPATPAAATQPVPYIKNEIPADVRQRAAQIKRLAPLYERMRPRPPIPEHYECLVTTGIMEIPVFDSSHPSAMGSRANRHLIDYTTYEQMIVSHRSPPYPVACCPQCRHPQPDPQRLGMLSQNMRIDVVLQKEILQFLQTHVAGG